ncbi:MAG TPA: AAA family ATPase [Thermoplasmata archaeon]|jgi:replication factor C small subunit
MNPEDLRPATLEEIVGQGNAVRVLKSLAAKANDGSGFPIPSLLFFGPPGVGKTTAAIAFAKELLGPLWRENFFEMNASDDRGIDTVRDRIIPYVDSMPSDGAPFKILFLDEADMLTPEAQAALRRTMETGSETTRFILAANRVSKVIDALRSRTLPIPFRPLSDAEIRRVVDEAAKKVGLTLDPTTVDAIVLVAEGQARDAVNLLLGGGNGAENYLTITSKVEALFKGTGPVVDRVEDFTGWVRVEGYSDIERVLLTIERAVVAKGLVPKEKIPRVSYEAASSAFRVAQGLAAPVLEVRAFLYRVLGAV